MNRRNRAIRTTLSLVAMAITCAVHDVLAHGLSEKNLVVTIFAAEQVCSEVSDFKEEAGGLFANWKKNADAAISRAKQTKFDTGKTFEESIAETTEGLRKEPKEKIQELCGELLRKFRTISQENR